MKHIEPKSNLAVKKFSEQHYNCCQAVICAYSDEFGVKEEDVFKMTEGFGTGMGGLKDTCGAVTGMFLTLGLINSAGNMADPFETKQETYKKLREMAADFEQKCGSLYCRDLKGFETGKPLASCKTCVETAAKILDTYLAASFEEA